MRIVFVHKLNLFPPVGRDPVRHLLGCRVLGCRARHPLVGQRGLHVELGALRCACRLGPAGQDGIGPSARRGRALVNHSDGRLPQGLDLLGALLRRRERYAHFSEKLRS